MGKVYKLDDVPFIELVKGAKSRLIVGQKVMVSFIELEPNMFFPLHRHDNEQIMIVIEGSMVHTLGDKKIKVSKGDVLVIESNELHGGQVSEEGCKAIDIFVPPREDYLKLMKG
ncbi:MAG: cupin domain-containing protein [Nitrososphaeria archaeon]|nr:cupin domain-containing protein [Nitrososphaeria archaeon]